MPIVTLRLSLLRRIGIITAVSYVIIVLTKQHALIGSHFETRPALLFPEKDALATTSPHDDQKVNNSPQIRSKSSWTVSDDKRRQQSLQNRTRIITPVENKQQQNQQQQQYGILHLMKKAPNTKRNVTLAARAITKDLKDDGNKVISRRTSYVPDGATISNPCGTCQFANNNLHESLCKKQQQQSSSSNNTKSSQSTRSIHPSCATLTLPLSYQTLTPRHCRPKLILLPSFPTNGNALVKETFSLLTNLITFSVYGKTEKGIPVMTLPFSTTPILRAEVRTWSFPLSKYCFSNNIIPTGGRPALAKTHLGYGVGRTPTLKKFDELSRFLDGVVRLARNPGDQLLRNAVRWKTLDNNNTANVTHFEKVAGGYCGRALNSSKAWNYFHDTWERVRENRGGGGGGGRVGHLVMRYEEFADGGRAVGVYKKLLAFVGERFSSENDVERMVRSVMRPPGYVQGGLFVEYCGVDMARRLHNETREMSRRLGYGFDEERGVWYLEELELDSIYRPMRHQVT